MESVNYFYRTYNRSQKHYLLSNRKRNLEQTDYNAFFNAPRHRSFSGGVPTVMRTHSPS